MANYIVTVTRVSTHKARIRVAAPNAHQARIATMAMLRPDSKDSHGNCLETLREKETVKVKRRKGKQL